MSVRQQLELVMISVYQHQQHACSAGRAAAARVCTRARFPANRGRRSDPPSSASSAQLPLHTHSSPTHAAAAAAAAAMAAAVAAAAGAPSTGAASGEGDGSSSGVDMESFYRQASYPLVKHTDMTAEMREEALDICITAVEKHAGDMKCTQLIKEQMDRKFGSPWHVIVGRAFGYEITHELRNILYLFVGGTTGVLLWKM